MSTPMGSHSPSSTADPTRKVQRVTPTMVAAARAQISIATRLGKPVPAVVRKVAQAR